LLTGNNMLKFKYSSESQQSESAKAILPVLSAKSESSAVGLVSSNNQTESAKSVTHSSHAAAIDSILRLANRGLLLFPIVPQGKVPFKGFAWKEKATNDQQQLRSWFEQFPACNWAARTGPEAKVFVLDVDGEDGRASLGLILKHGAFPPTLTTFTGNEWGLHCWFRYPAKGDLLNSVGKIAPGLDVRGRDGYVVVPPSVHQNGTQYAFDNEDADIKSAPDWLLQLIANSSQARVKGDVLEPGTPIPVGERDDTLFRDACAIRRRGATEKEILAYLKEANRRCEKPLGESQLLKIARSAADYEPHNSQRQLNLPHAALHGVAGKVVDTILPHTEADPAALLLHFLAAFGNIIGRHAYCSVDGAKHYTNIFFACVGATAKGRKGTSWNRIRGIMELLDLDWSKDRIQTGLSSGEGLIAAAAHQGGADSDVGTQMPDGRLFIIEAELASVLKRMARDGNTLSPTVRDAWDTGSFQIMVKRDPVKVKDAHISIVGHITAEELTRSLTHTDMANGFANRFLWAWSVRSKCLPEGGALTENQMFDLAHLIKPAVAFGQKAGVVQRDKDAKAIWAEVYPALSEGNSGLFGAVTSRAEAQVLRLSLIYALLDCSKEIRPAHLEAALGVWEYCRRTTEWIFSDLSGNSIADGIFSLLQTRRDGVTTSDLMNYFNRHISSAELRLALDQLKAAGDISVSEIKTKGRTARVWKAKVFRQDEDEEKGDAESRVSSEYFAKDLRSGTSNAL
jgi:hypothetical protein